MPKRDELDRELDEELATFVDLLTQENVRAGMSPGAARRAALIELGGRTQVKERVRDVRWWSAAVDTLVDDVRYSVRSLRRTPAFTLVVATTLAVGIGATTAIFSAIEAVLLRPFSGGDVSRQVQLFNTWRDADENVSAADFLAWKQYATSFQAMGAVAYNNVTLMDDHSADRFAAGRVTSGFFSSVGQPAALGRTLRDDEDEPGKDRVVVLSDALWRDRFGRDPQVIGRIVQLNARPFTVVGVMPPTFDPLLAGERLWIPLVLPPDVASDRDSHFLNVVGQLRPHIGVRQAQAQLDGIARQLRQRFPVDNKDVGVHAVALREANVGPLERRMYVMLGAVLLVLLIACGNVSNLMLARGSARAKELAVRGALGASRARLMRQLATESLTIGVAAALLGVGVAGFVIRIVVRFAPPNVPRLSDTRIDLAVLGVAFTAGVASSVVFGLIPALRGSRFDLQSILRDGGRGTAGSVRDHVRAILVASEVALALTLLIGAGLLIRSAINLQRVNSGFTIEGLLTARVALPPADEADSAIANRAYEHTFTRLVNELEANPAFAAVALASQAPLDVGGTTNGLLPTDKAPASRDFIQSRLHVVTPGYFKTLGIPLEAGRTFTWADRHESPRAMIISETVARRAFPGQNPIGKGLRCCEQAKDGVASWTVVGVVGDVHGAGPAAKIEPEFYLPLAQTPSAAWGWMNRTMTVLGRATRGEPSALVPIVRRATAEISQAIPVYAVATMEDNLGATLADARFNTLLLSALGSVGLLLAAVGIYGVIGYFVTLRTREIGIRIALGATGFRIAGLMALHGMRPVLVGAVLGCAAAAALTRVLSDSLFEVTAHDPLTFGVVVAALLTTALIACIIPARRAARVDPLVAIAE